MSGHDDLMLPLKAAYFILPVLLALRFEGLQVVDTESENVDQKWAFGFDPFILGLNLLIPSSVQIVWMVDRLYENAFASYKGDLLMKKLRFDFSTVQPRMCKLRVTMSENELNKAFKECDLNSDGMLSRSESRAFIDRVFTFKDEALRMTDQLAEVIWGTFSASTSDKLEKSEIMAYCL